MRHKSWLNCSDTRYLPAVALLILSLTVDHVSALYVVPGSNCTDACTSAITAYTTNGSDIVCHDIDYNSTTIGEAFQICVSCEIQSPALNPYTVQTDVGWALYNMRYSLDWCLFGFPNNGNQSSISSQTTQCQTSCTNMSKSLEINILTPNITSTYDYCEDPSFLPNVDGCAKCLAKVPNQLYSANFLNTLAYACRTQPAPTLAFPIRPSEIFTWNPPSNYSTMNCSSGGNLPYSTRVAIAISVPIGSFVIITLLLIVFYVHRNTNEQYYRPPPTQKSISKSDSAWSKSPNYRSPNHQTPSRKNHSRNHSGNSRPYPGIAPLKPEKIAMPGPLRPRSSKSPVPSSKSPYPPSPIPPVPPIPLQNRAPNSPIPFSTLFNQSIPQQPPSSPPPILTSPSQTFLPATRYSPTSSKPRKPYTPPISKFRRKPKPKDPPPPQPQHPGLVSWERIAIQNARIRATQQGRSPSPAVSPLSQPPPRGNRNNTQQSDNNNRRNDNTTTTATIIPPLSQSPAFMDMVSREATPFRLGTPLHPPPPRTPKRRGTPGQGEVLREREGRVVSQGWDGRGAVGEGEGWGGTSWYDEGDNGNGNGNDDVGGVVQAGRWSANSGPGVGVVVGRMDSETLGNTIAMGRGRGGGGGDSTPGSSLSMQRGNRSARATRWGAREEFRADTPNPDDGRLVRRSEGGVMRMGSGRSKGSRKEVRWSKDVDYEGRG